MCFNHKLFWKLISLFAVMDLCLLLTACGDWESQAINIIGLLGPAIQAVIAILAAFGVGVPPTVMEQFTNWAQQAQQALLTVKGLILQIKTAEASAQPGILNAIQVGLQTVASDLNTILPELHITNADTQAKIAAAFAAIIGFIGTIINLLPAIKPAMTVAEGRELEKAAQGSAKEFKAQFNEAAGYFGKQYTI